VEAAKTPLLTHLCSHLAPLGFEARRPPPPASAPRRSPPRAAPQTRKEVAQVFCGLVRVAVDGRSPGVAYLVAHKELVVQLTKGCGVAARGRRAARGGAGARAWAAPAGAANRSRLAHPRPASSGWTRR